MGFQELTKMVTYAYNHVEYYNKLFEHNSIDVSSIKLPSDLSQIPILKKDMIQANQELFISNEYKQFPKNENIIIRRTSGSTGKNLRIYWDYKDDIKSLMPLWVLRKHLYGIEPNMKWCSFHSVNYDGNKIKPLCSKTVDMNGKHISFSKIGLNNKKIYDIYKEIIEFNPDWMLLQPSIAYLMSQVIEDNGLIVPANLKHIEMTGEYLYDNYRTQIKNIFKINPVNQYGCNEVNEIAYECKGHNMHIVENNVIVEVIKNGKSVMNEEGDIYITSLKNYAMPFIRYETGDKGMLIDNHNCTCGSSSPILILRSGRSSDFITLKNGETLNSYVLLNTLEYTNEYMSCAIKQFQITQLNYDCFNVNLVIKDDFLGWKESIKQCFLENIQEEQLKNLKWNFTFSDNIFPDKETGKYKFFINMVK